MFKDDRMIPVLSAMVLMIVLGTFLQRMEAVDRWMGGGEAEAALVLRDDEVDAPAGAVLRIDVFANDVGIGDRATAGLSIVKAPACGRLFVRGGVLEYYPGPACAGRHEIRYTVAGAGQQQVARVIARIRPGGTALPAEDDPAVVASASGAKGVEPADASVGEGATDLEGRPGAGAPGWSGMPAGPTAITSAAPSARDAAAGGGASSAGASGDDRKAAESSSSSAAGGQAVAAPAGDTSGTHNARIAVPSIGVDEVKVAAVDPVAAPVVAPVAASAEATVTAVGPAPVAGALAPHAPAGPSPALPVGAASAAPPSHVASVSASSPAGASQIARPAALGPVGEGIGSTPGAGAAPTSAALMAPASGGPADQGAGGPVVASSPDDPAPSGATPAPDAPVPGADATRLASLPSAPASPGAALAAGPEASVEPDKPSVRFAVLIPPGEDAVAYPAAALAMSAIAAAAPARPAAGRAPVGPSALPAPRPAAPQFVLAHAGGHASVVRDESSGAVSAATSAGGPAFVLSVIGGAGMADLHGTHAPNPPPARGAAAAGPAGERLASLAPQHLALPPSSARGPALSSLPAERMIIPIPRPKRNAAEAAQSGTPPAGPAAASAPCTAVPAMTLQVRGAGETMVFVEAPCHAGTVAELSYSGLRLAVPVDEHGRGSVSVLGFEPSSAAVLSFWDGKKFQLDLPFKGIDRVSRVALAWDAPVELGLNALELGAPVDSRGHVRPGAPRSFDEVRKDGGGWLAMWLPVAGVGQSVQVYSWYHRDGEAPGVVRLLVDFVSRDRDRRPSACGSGADAAPQFVVLRSNAGRPERPVVRQIAALDCAVVASQGGDTRLISGAVDDLVITSR